MPEQFAEISVASLPPGAIADAVARHKAGDLDRAEGLYRDILEAEPDHVQALHFLGVIAHQKGDHRRAIELIGRAITLYPNFAEAYSNLGAAHHALDEFEQAEAAFRHAAELRPSLAEAHSNLATTLNRLGQPDEAAESYKTAHRIAPTTPRFIKRLGDLYLEHRQFADAAEWFERYLSMATDNGEVSNNAGYAHEQLGELEAAERHYRDAVALCPTSPEINSNLGSLLVRLGRAGEGQIFLDRALETDPAKWQDAANAAKTFINRGQAENAIAILNKLLETRPDDAGLHHDLAVAQSIAGRPEAAECAYRTAIRIDPAHAGSLNNLGGLLMSQGRYSEAIEQLKAAIACQPRYLDAHLNICLALCFDNRVDDAYLYAKAAVILESFRPNQFSNPHKVFRAVCDFDAIDQLGDVWAATDRLRATADFSANFLEMLVLADTEDGIGRLVDLHRRWYDDLVKPQRGDPLSLRSSGTGRGKVRIGILSSDLRNHSVAKFVLPVLEHYDRDRFEFVCYSPIEHTADPVQQHIRSLVADFKVLPGHTDREFAEIIRADGIDILFELNGFTRSSRLKVLSHKPAPVQIYWLGYPFTTGLAETDYILLDPYLEPVNESWLVEEPLLMPKSWVCIGGFEPVPISKELPVERNGVVTFGSLNNPYKLTREVIALWSRVMHEVPDSCFLYVRPECKSFVLCSNLAREFGRNGIGQDRLFFVNNRAGVASHLAYYDQIDVTLDTFPLTGGTTTCDTLWMGAPVVTKYGPSMHQRLSYSMLKNVGLDQLCVETDDDYVRIAVALAQDTDSLHLLRCELRQSVQESALGRAEDFARDFCDLMAQVASRHGLR